MKIMHLLQSDRFSGAENVVCQIISMFAEDKTIEHIYCSVDGQVREVVSEKGIEFFALKDFSLKEVNRAINEVNPDIIHAHDMHASFKAALCLKNKKLICHIHNNSFDSRKASIKTILFKYAANKASHIFWVSDSSYENFFYKEKYIQKSSVLYNILDISKIYEKMELDNNEYDYDIVYLGRLSEPKNPQRLLRVLEQIIALRPSTKLAVVGTGELETEVKAKAETMNFNNNLHFLGFQSNPYKILSDAKLMILTSLWEGTPMCSLEAMSLGVPIVSTPTDGLCKVIVNNVTGFLSDNDNEIVKSCCRLLDDEELQKEMAIKSKERARSLMNIDEYRTKIKDAYMM